MAVAVCGQPHALLGVLQQTIPPQIYALLLQVRQEFCTIFDTIFSWFTWKKPLKKVYVLGVLVILYAPNCLDFSLEAKAGQKNWLKLLLCLQILNLDWTTLWNRLNSLPNGHSGVRMVLDLFWTSRPCKSLQKVPKQNSPLILLQNFGPPIIF